MAREDEFVLWYTTRSFDCIADSNFHSICDVKIALVVLFVVYHVRLNIANDTI